MLCRLEAPNLAQKMILGRQGEADAEQEESDIIEDFFSERLSRLMYNPDTDWIHVPNDITAEWFNWATNERQRVTSVSRLLNQLTEEGRLKHIHRDPSRTHGRGFLWAGSAADPNSGKWTDLRDRWEKNIS